jgi:predicted dinucleotide-binding enzyme
MQVENVIAFAVEQEPSGLEIRVNFGVFSGRDATAAELEELGRLLQPEAGEVSIVGEQRHEVAEDAEVVVHQVRVSVAPEVVPADRDERKELCDRLITLAEIWARQCINERRAEISEL